MRNLGILAVLGSIAAFSFLAGCGDDGNESSGGGGQSATQSSSSASSSSATGTGGSGGNGGSGGGTADTAKVRVAHLSPDAPAVDFCVQPDGAAFIGPVLKATFQSATGLAYPSATAYLDLPPGGYTARLVAPNAANCNESLGGLPDVKDIKVDAGSFYTLAAIGELATGATNAFQVKAFVDDGAVGAGKAKLRFVHASPDTPNVDVGTGSGVDFKAIYTNVPYPMVGQVGGKDYLETDPLSKVTISARATGTTADALVLNDIDLPAGAIATAFAIGKLSGMPQPLKVLLCVDNGTPAGFLTPCVVAP